VLPPNSILLRRHPHTDLIYWPDTMYVVKSFDDPVVIAKEATPEMIVALSETDKRYLTAKRIPYRQIDLVFRGDKRPPPEVIREEFNKLFKAQLEEPTTQQDLYEQQLKQTFVDDFGLRSNSKKYDGFALDSPTLGPCNDLLLQMEQYDLNDDDDHFDDLSEPMES
jgi:hypothetical protein